MMRRCLLLLMALWLAMTPCRAQAFKEMPFIDFGLPSIVQELRHLGIMEGYPDGSFQWKKPITRLELALAIYRIIKDTQEGGLLAERVKKLAQ